MSTSKKERAAARRQAELEAQRRAAAAVRQRRIFVAVAIAVIVLLVGGGIGVQAWRTQRDPRFDAAGAPNFGAVQIVDGQPLRLGAAGAKATLALYEDFHCPHCADFEKAYSGIVTAAQRDGRLAVDLYPMAFIDKGSTAAANAMACAAEAGFGEAYYLGLFANHDLTWNDRQLIGLAGQITTVPDAFRTCVTTKAHAGWVTSINSAADAKGVNQTPTAFLDGTTVDIGTLTPQSLQAMIDKAAGA